MSRNEAEIQLSVAMDIADLAIEGPHASAPLLDALERLRNAVARDRAYRAGSPPDRCPSCAVLHLAGPCWGCGRTHVAPVPMDEVTS